MSFLLILGMIFGPVVEDLNSERQLVVGGSNLLPRAWTL